MASSSSESSNKRALLTLFLCLGAVLLAMFYPSFLPGQALFSNDGPLAAQKAAFIKLPSAFFGVWNDLYWLGAEAGSFAPNFTALILMILGPLGYTNFHAPCAILLLGLASYLYFRQLNLSPAMAIVAALAAAFNGNFISNAGWGLSSRASCLAMTFFALAALEGSFKSRPVVKTILAGLAVGLSVSEGGDNGAIFSLFVAAYGFFRALFMQGPAAKQILAGAGRVLLMAVCAGFIAAHTISFFIGPSKGAPSALSQVEGMTPEQRWNWATQWSLPKSETLRVLIPGLYGYKMDTPDGGNYWGGVGQDAYWAPGSGRLARHSGAGEYAGVLVILIAAWTLAQSFRKTRSPFEAPERNMIWFWGGAALVALILSWGRHAPFYQLIYHLPFFNTIRNPMKFMHPFHLTTMVLFAYGLKGMSRLYLQNGANNARSVIAQIGETWSKGQPFEKGWMIGSVGALILATLGYLIYATSKASLVAHLKRIEFPESQAVEMARFSIGEFGLFVLFLGISVALVLSIQSGYFSGKRSLWATTLLGLILMVDLYRANTPWINYYDYQKRYASNPVIDILKDKPYLQRTTVFPQFPGAPPALGTINQVYQLEWLQHHFLYYNIPALDVPQDPRPPARKAPYLQAVGNKVARYWQLTSTRYILALAGGFAESMNQQLDPGGRGFRQRVAFNVSQDTDRTISAHETPDGPYALIELTNALPRAKLYCSWEVSTNDQVTLTNYLGNPSFNPMDRVVVNQELTPPAGTNPNSGAVEFLSYSPRRIDLKTTADHDGILLLNDRYHPSWKVSVDGETREMLRCNFLMRGVQVPAGTHTVRFSYAPEIGTLYVTLAAVILGLVLCVSLAVPRRGGNQTS